MAIDLNMTNGSTQGQRLVLDLNKSQTLNQFDVIDLAKDDYSLDRIMLGAGWDPARFGGSIDLDLSLHLYDEAGKSLNTIYYGNKEGQGIVHSGDNLTGDGNGDDEQIHVTLSQLPVTVARIEISLTSFSRTPFNKVANSFIRILDVNSNREIARLNITQDGGKNTMLHFGQLVKVEGKWSFKALSEFGKVTGTTPPLSVTKAYEFYDSSQGLPQQENVPEKSGGMFGKLKGMFR